MSHPITLLKSATFSKNRAYYQLKYAVFVIIVSDLGNIFTIS